MSTARPRRAARPAMPARTLAEGWAPTVVEIRHDWSPLPFRYEGAVHPDAPGLAIAHHTGWSVVHLVGAEDVKRGMELEDAQAVVLAIAPLRDWTQPLGAELPEDVRTRVVAVLTASAERRIAALRAEAAHPASGRRRAWQRAVEREESRRELIPCFPRLRAASIDTAA